MPFVESDFLLALVKDDDWLKGSALRAYEKYKGKLWTSGFTIAEVLLVSEQLKLDQENLIVHIYRIVEVNDLNEATALLIAHYMKNGLTTFDAFHAAYAESDEILSSDRVYDKIGLKRLKLEEL